MLTMICNTGLRAVRLDWYTSATFGGLRDGSGLHIYNAEATAACHQG